MSKKSERQKEKRKQTIRDACIVGVIALIFLVLGIIGLVNHKSSYNDYKDSDDVRKVDAVITYVEVKSRKGDYDKKVYYWKADVEYEVNGEEFSGTTEFSTEVKKGDTRSIEVFRSKDGSYKIPEITNDTAYKIWSILYIGSIVLGVILGIICVVVALPDGKKK